VIGRLKEDVFFSNLPTLENLFLDYLPKINAVLSHLVVSSITTLADIAISLVLTPFVLYYFFRDDALFSRFILRFVPTQFQEEVHKILQDVDTTLSEFITAQMTVAGLIGGVLLIGYLLIGLPHALPLALFAMIFYVIPFLGTFIAIIPALGVALSIDMFMTLKVIAVMFGAHFVESNLLTPRLMSHRLNIHPLTIILLLLAAGSLYGLFGLLLVTPTYAILKVIIWNIYKISHLRYIMAKTKEAAAQSTQEPS
jgi:predicted PurR-regulated permease PerM